MTQRTAITSATMVLAAAFCVLFIGGGARFAIGVTLKSAVEEFAWGRSALGIAVALCCAIGYWGDWRPGLEAYVMVTGAKQRVTDAGVR